MKCDGHLGHVFVGEHFQQSKVSRSDQRHCVNSICLKYVKGDIPKELLESTLELNKK
jgi:peptide methionine sulfoxide reductase MsrB